ncbi:ATP-NAD kinase family protein [Moritella marina ATCC 15381]|uniref:ATP-NAD kinase family protein n=1 Tax=Moritella marina ATCC 15381 TaxID=1202962 RepID=A0A5J6WHR4_MORMI|nr:ATP-NAD kinase family protein [Moritella marina]QFI36748.1 ATP-NAD kinase family protein [Moritella marina ATCC 15381]
MNVKPFKLEIIINPVAGVGGSVALKGSDNVAQQALSLGAIPQANNRMLQALGQFADLAPRFSIVTAGGEMGERCSLELGLNVTVVYRPANDSTTEQDTYAAVEALLAQDIDLLLFAGGDGTARNICATINDVVPVLGVPAGCKIHSGVYGVTPKAAGCVVRRLILGELVTLADADVMDIDEVAFRQGTVKAKRYGEMMVPSDLRYVQSVKMGGIESDELVLTDIAADVMADMEDEYYIMGSGSTVAFAMAELGLDNTLLGVDVVHQHELIAADQTAAQLIALTQDKPCKLVITLIGGQGHIFGRGNQQLSPQLIKQIGKENIIVLATKTKLSALAGRPLIVDTGDVELDQALSGFIRVTTGYRDYIMYRVANPEYED